MPPPNGCFWPVADVRKLKMAHFFWRCFPIVVLTVQIRDRRIHEFFWRDIVQARYVDRIELAPARRASNSKRTNPAIFAKEVLVGLRQKLIFSEFGFARQ
jgi:hypothetical protein